MLEILDYKIGALIILIAISLIFIGYLLRRKLSGKQRKKNVVEPIVTTINEPKFDKEKIEGFIRGFQKEIERQDPNSENYEKVKNICERGIKIYTAQLERHCSNKTPEVTTKDNISD